MADTTIESILPEGFVSLGFVVAIKCLNEDGEVSLATFRSEEISAWESWGMLMTVVEDVKNDINSRGSSFDD